MQKIAAPKYRSPLRQILGREYHIFKRKWKWMTGKTKWATRKENDFPSHKVFEHRSLILRPLKDVDMYLQENKRTNLALAIKHLDGIVIGPGETFSIWKLVGRPTASKGYLEGLVLKQGTVGKAPGGGLCQLGNLLFWIFAHSPLSITERHRHGFDVFPDVNRKVPFGAGATLSYNHVDLQVTNNTSQSFKIQLWLDETHLNGKLYSEFPITEKYSVEERNHRMDQQFWGGYSRHNEIFQLCDSNGEITESLLVENHAIMMYSPFLPETKK